MRIFISYKIEIADSVNVGGVKVESKGYTCLYRMQTKKLSHHEKQEKWPR